MLKAEISVCILVEDKKAINLNLALNSVLRGLLFSDLACEPLVAECFVQSDPLFLVFLKQLGDEVLRVVADVVPAWQVEHQLFL